MTSFKTTVSVPSRARDRSSNHSMMTATTCSRKVSYARRTVTPSSICAIFWAISRTRGTSVLISMTSRPRSSMRFAMSVASSRGVGVREQSRSMTSVNECFSSFQSTMEYWSFIIGSALGWRRRSASLVGTLVSSGEQSRVSRTKSSAYATVRAMLSRSSGGTGTRCG